MKNIDAKLRGQAELFSCLLLLASLAVPMSFQDNGIDNIDTFFCRSSCIEQNLTCNGFVNLTIPDMPDLGEPLSVNNPVCDLNYGSCIDICNQPA